MSKDLSSVFQLPVHAPVFERLLAQLDDNGARIDTVDFLERIGPAFLAYEEATRSRRITITNRGKHNPLTTDYYIFCRELLARGTFQYRMVSINSRGHVNIIDADRLLDDTELFRGKIRREAQDRALDRLRHSFAHRLEVMVGKGFSYVARSLGREMAWIDDFAFLHQASASFQNLESARRRFAGQMMRAIEDLTAGNPGLHRHLNDAIVEVLANFDAGRAEQSAALLQEAAARLDPSVMALLTPNPSSLRISNYRWLAEDRGSAAGINRHALIAACPILLLTRDLRKNRNVASFIETGIETDGDAEDAIARIFHVTDRRRVALYRQLRESHIGADNAAFLPDIAAWLEPQRQHIAFPQRPADWDRLRTLISASQSTAQILGRAGKHVLSEFIAGGDDVIARHFAVASRGRYQRLEELETWKRRISASVLSPKVVTEAHIRQIDIPVQHIFYMVSGFDLVRRDAVAAIPRKLRQAIDSFSAERSLIHTMLDGVDAGTLLDAAMDFYTHRHNWDQSLRELIITNRLDERGAAYALPELPVIRMEDYGYTVDPVRSQSDLTKAARRLNSLFVFKGQEAVLSGHHFIRIMRRQGVISAIAEISEPDHHNGRWNVEAVEVSDYARNIDFRLIAQAYVDSPEFLKNVDLQSFARVRADLQTRLERLAKNEELMGVNPHDAEEKRAVLQILDPYIHVAGDYDIDEHGCLSHPKINARVSALLRETGPYYPRRNDRPAPIL